MGILSKRSPFDWHLQTLLVEDGGALFGVLVLRNEHVSHLRERHEDGPADPRPELRTRVDHLRVDTRGRDQRHFLLETLAETWNRNRKYRNVASSYTITDQLESSLLSEYSTPTLGTACNTCGYNELPAGTSRFSLHLNHEQQCSKFAYNEQLLTLSSCVCIFLFFVSEI